MHWGDGEGGGDVNMVWFNASWIAAVGDCRRSCCLFCLRLWKCCSFSMAVRRVYREMLRIAAVNTGQFACSSLTMSLIARGRLECTTEMRRPLGSPTLDAKHCM